MLSYKIQNALSLRHKDQNGYLMVEKSPILLSGVLEYYGSELLPDGADDVDGVKVDPDKVYKVFIPEEELKKGADSFRMIPITDGHTWLGDEGEDPKKYQEGTTGENIFVENGMLYAPLKFTGKNIIDEIESGEREELSSSYYNRFEKSENPLYDFIARDLKGNHLALVDKGRCGSAVRVLNSEKKGVNEMAEEVKTENKAILELDGNRINLDAFFEEEKQEEVHDDSITENNDAVEDTEVENEVVDKRDVIREIMAIAGKANEDFEGGEDEKIETIARLAEKLAYNDSETSKTDNEDEVTEEDKDEDLEDEEVKSEDCSKSQNYDAIYARVENALKKERDEQEKALYKAYNSAKSVLGDFNAFGMSEKDIYVKALNHMGVSLDGQEGVVELSAMLRACKSVNSKVDNGFCYDSVAGTEEIDLNI